MSLIQQIQTAQVRAAEDVVLRHLAETEGALQGHILPETTGVLVANPTSFQRVAAMNEAFGNPKPTTSVDVARLRKQCLNIVDEFGELMKALGADETAIKAAIEGVKWIANKVVNKVDPEGVRDALCDIHVFAYGAHHFMGIDADADMVAVVDGIMTRFIKDDADKAATIAIHAAAGVTDVYFEGSFPTMVMKSASDQPDAPKGKFLKSASYRLPVFPVAV